MSLFQVTVPLSEFESIYSHIARHKPRYANMHLREACQRAGSRDLRYLHAMHVPGAGLIEGMISGPEVFWHYSLQRARHGTQLNVLQERGSDAALERIGRRFLTEISNRVEQEKQGGEYFPRYSPGQYYLRRQEPGSDPSSLVCVRAVADGVLDQSFVDQLANWKFCLLNP